MQREVRFDKLEHFIDEMKRLGITKIAFAEINEKRAVQVDAEKLEVADVVQLEILAYKDSTIYKFQMKDADFEYLYDRLTEDGFEIVRRSRNIT